MITCYDEKIVVSGSTIEYYLYKIRQGLPQRQKQKLSYPLLSRFDTSLYRAKKNIQRLILCNTDLNKFITLTFAEKHFDLSTANYAFKLFINRLKYQYANIKYLVIPEIHKDRSYHFHALANLPYIQNDEFALRFWQNGYTKIKKVNQTDGRLQNYLTKYLNKQNSVIKSKRSYFHSLNLNKPLTITNLHIIKAYNDDIIKNNIYKSTLSTKIFDLEYYKLIDEKICSQLSKLSSLMT